MCKMPRKVERKQQTINEYFYKTLITSYDFFHVIWMIALY